MDIGILATFTEGISNSIVEYMALGKPVVATSGGGTNEIVKAIDAELKHIIKAIKDGSCIAKTCLEPCQRSKP